MLPTAGGYSVFAHLNVEKAALYRQVLKLFVDAKSRFVIHLRPADVERQLLDRGLPLEEVSPIETALQQLVTWGNLESHPDTAEVATVQDFWRVRSLYQMSVSGEAAETALAEFEKSIRQPGELQSAALDDIRQQLRQILRLLQDPEAPEADVFNTFQLLRNRFDELTAQAQRFISGVQRRIDLEALDVQSFLDYKQRLIDYLERFLSELVRATHEIGVMIRSIDGDAIRPLLERLADRELVDRLITTDEERSAVMTAWQQRWEGLCAWFVGTAERPSQAEELRRAARAAIPSLIAAVTGINDRRAGRSDRAADLRALAVWFAEAEDDRAAHRLWRAAFSLHSCRHLSIDSETLAARESDPVSSSTSWLEAPPMLISPRLHRSGRYTPRGRPVAVIDRSAERRLLARRAREEAEQIRQSLQALATGRRMRLSQFDELPYGRFRLFLDVLGDALAAKPSPEAPVSTTSSDGTLRIELEPTGDGEVAVIRTSIGVLIGEDHFITIHSNVEADRSAAGAAGRIQEVEVRV